MKFVPTAATVPQVLDFLQVGLDKGLSANSSRRQVAALATILLGEGTIPVSQHPRVHSILKGLPPTVHRYPTWDLSLVLQVLTSPPFKPLGSASFRLLTLKMAFLIAVTSASRISELTALSVRQDLFIFHPNRVMLHLDPIFVPKINIWFHRAQEVILPGFCPNPRYPHERLWHTLDVRRALRKYIKRTASFRWTKSLFVSFQPRSMGKKISPSTIGRWLKACIALAYKHQARPTSCCIMAHSTRSAATTMAWATQALILEICRVATWASPLPFIKNYKLDMFASAEAAFRRCVLQWVLPAEGTLDQSIFHPTTI